MKRPFCDKGCKHNYKTDRKMGLIYGSWLVPVKSVPANVQAWESQHEDMVFVGWEDGSRINGTCAYCGDSLKKEVNREPST